MRAVAMVGILVALSFAGCLEADPLEADSETGSVQAQYNAVEADADMPERRFEPLVVLDTPELQVPQGANPELEFYVTDLKDYPFPMTFIDWAVFHDRNPNPVAEGDATDLPSTYNQTIYASGYHMFGFRVDDTQGLNETRIIILEVGKDHEQELPTPYQIAHFRWRIDTYFGDAGLEPLPAAGEAAVDPCAGAPVQEPHTASGTMIIGGALGGGFITRLYFPVTACQYVINADVRTTYGDIMLEIRDPSGATVAAKDIEGFGGEFIVYVSETPLEVGEWHLYVRPFAAGPDTYDMVVNFHE